MKLALESHFPCNVKFFIKIRTSYIPRNKLERCLHFANISDSRIDTNFCLTLPHSFCTHMKRGYFCLRSTTSVTVTLLATIAIVTGRAQSSMAVSFEVESSNDKSSQPHKEFPKEHTFICKLLLFFHRNRSIKRNKLNNKENNMSPITLKLPSLQVFCLN